VEENDEEKDEEKEEGKGYIKKKEKKKRVHYRYSCMTYHDIRTSKKWFYKL